MVFSDFNPARVIITDEGNVSYEILLFEGHSPYDVVTIDYRTVAVACFECIVIVDIIDKREVRSIPTNDQCYGMFHANGFVVFVALDCFPYNQSISKTAQSCNHFNHQASLS